MNQDPIKSELAEVVVTVAKQLQQQLMRLVTAESCTGGLIAKLVTDLPGASDWFAGGFITYSNQMKRALLNVRSATLDSWGAVSEQVVKEMAAGALRNSGADISLSVSGIAGPGGGSAEKPVGTVWIGWCRKGETAVAKCFRYEGGREQVRNAAALSALQGLSQILNKTN